MPELETSVIVDATVGEVWEAFTDAHVFATWLWPASFGTVAEIQAQPGGSWSARSTSVGIGVSGRVLRARGAARTALDVGVGWRAGGDRHLRAR